MPKALNSILNPHDEGSVLPPLATILKKCPRKLGITQKKLVSNLKMTIPTWNSLLNSNNPRISVLLSFSQLYGANLLYYYFSHMIEPTRGIAPVGHEDPQVILLKAELEQVKAENEVHKAALISAQTQIETLKEAIKLSSK